MEIISIAFFLVNVLCSQSTLLNDVCDENDIECLHPQISQPGETTLGKCVGNKTIVRLQMSSFLKCLKECIITSGCKSVSYRRMWKMCDLNGGNYTEEDFLVENGCLHSDISSWPVTLGGKCKHHACKEGEKCNGTGNCEPAYCKGDPDVPNTKTLEKFGNHKTLGYGVNYGCVDGLMMCGRPFAVCEKTGLWKTLFYCTENTLISCRKPTNQSSNGYPDKYFSNEGVDGIRSSGFFHTEEEDNPWWWVDLQDIYKVGLVNMTNRGKTVGDRLSNMTVYVGNTTTTTDMETCGTFDGPGRDDQLITINCNGLAGKFVKLEVDFGYPRTTKPYFHLSEVEVYKYV